MAEEENPGYHCIRFGYNKIITETTQDIINWKTFIIAFRVRVQRFLLRLYLQITRHTDVPSSDLEIRSCKVQAQVG